MRRLEKFRPPLESGDRLTREEFHCRYSEYPEIKKAELVEGVVYVGGRVRTTAHGEPHALVVGWLGLYAAEKPDLHVANSTTVFLDERNEVQPDAVLLRFEPGVVRETEDDFVEGAPQLIVEVALSSASYDLHDKKEAYRRSRVREYVVLRTLDDALDWFELRDGAYARREPDERGIIESGQFPGLRLHVPSLLARDAAGVIGALGPSSA